MAAPADQEHLEEAKRLAQLPIADRRAVIALHRSVAEDPKVSKSNRQEARQRADTLERLLRLRPGRKSKNP